MQFGYAHAAYATVIQTRGLISYMEEQGGTGGISAPPLFGRGKKEIIKNKKT